MIFNNELKDIHLYCTQYKTIHKSNIQRYPHHSHPLWEITYLLLEVEILVVYRIRQLDLHHHALLPRHRVHHMQSLTNNNSTWCTTSLEKGCRIIALRELIVSLTCFSTAAWKESCVKELFVLLI